jgi:hypothetical protein
MKERGKEREDEGEWKNGGELERSLAIHAHTHLCAHPSIHRERERVNGRMRERRRETCVCDSE